MMMDVEVLTISNLEVWSAVQTNVSDGCREPAGARVELAKCPAAAAAPAGALARLSARRGLWGSARGLGRWAPVHGASPRGPPPREGADPGKARGRPARQEASGRPTGCGAPHASRGPRGLRGKPRVGRLDDGQGPRAATLGMIR